MFVDLHLHPYAKPYLVNYEYSPWRKIPALLGILKSQGTFTDFKRAGMKLAVTSIVPVEDPFSSSVMLQLLGPVASKLPKDHLNHINNSHYFDLVKEELKVIDKDPRADELNFMRKWSDYDDSKINLIMSIEGGHALFGRESFLDNLRWLKTHPKYRFFSLNLTHLTQQGLASHAYGMKMLKGNDEFKPDEYGISKDGHRVIEMAFDENVGHRMLIDMKHMSLKSRLQYYQIAQENNYPLLASHVAATGFPIKDMPQHIKGIPKRRDQYIEVKYKRVKGIASTSFNPWSINFFDDEIREFVKRKGMIGLSMDQRILGANRVKGEYFSAAEFLELQSLIKQKIDFIDGTFQDEVEEVPKARPGFHLKHMCNQIIHFVRVGGEEAWDILGLGSDFDGLINPIDICETVAQYPDLKAGLLKELPAMIKRFNKFHPDEPVDGSNIEDKIDRICYKNALRFLETHFV